MIRTSMLALVALAMAIPPATAVPDAIAIEGPPLPNLLPGHDPDDLVRIYLKDTDAEGANLGVVVAGLSLQMQAGCAASAPVSASAPAMPGVCSGRVCMGDSGNGPMPLSFGSAGHGYVGFGVDLDWLLGGGPEGDPSVPQEEGEYGPYSGAFVSKQGQCGA